MIAGVDTLEVGYCVNEYRLSSYMAELSAAKERSQSTPYSNELGVVEFQGYPFQVQRGSGPRSNYVLKNKDLEVSINEECNGGKYFPELKVRFYSELLWRKGWKEAIHSVDDWVNSWALIEAVKPSRVDLTCDIETPLPKLSESYSEVVTRSRKKATYANRQLPLNNFSTGVQRTGYVFGKEPVMCRMYDKTLEVKGTDKEWFHDLWKKADWNPADAVTRVEFQCRRPYLKEMGINSIETLVAEVPDIWNNLVNCHISLRDPNFNDSRRSRWRYAPIWENVQSALPLFGTCSKVERMKQAIPTYANLRKQLRGIMVSMAACANNSLGNDPKILAKFPQPEYGIQLLSATINHIKQEPDFKEDVEIRKKALCKPI